MRATVLIRQNQTEWAGSWGDCFREGLRRHGWEVDLTHEYRRADMIVVWGVSQAGIIERARRDDAEICVLERAYLPDRFAYSSVSFGGGLNGRGIFRGPFDDRSRFDRLFGDLMSDWNPKADGYALIMEQIPGDNSVRGVDMPAFYDRAARAFAGIGIATKTRAHPRCSPKSGVAAIAASYDSLAADLTGARCVVTWNSNSAVDAVLAGIPAVAMDEGSMAWDVSGHELAPPPMPDRSAWAAALAWKQWSREEMASGECWEAIGCHS